MQEQNAGSADTGSLTLFFNQLKAGDPSAAEGLWASFFPRLLGLARKVLSGRPQRISDAEDAAQSAFASFCLRVQAGEYALFDRNEMWKLLSVITANKARMQVRRELAEKRGGGRVTGEDALLNSEGNQVPLANLAIAQAAEFDSKATWDQHWQPALVQPCDKPWRRTFPANAFLLGSTHLFLVSKDEVHVTADAI